MKGLEGILMIKKNDKIIYFDPEEIIKLQSHQKTKNTSHQEKENHKKV